MIYIAEINIAAHERWGDVFSGEFTLPPKIYRLKSVVATANPDLNYLSLIGNQLHKVTLQTDNLEYHQWVMNQPSSVESIPMLKIYVPLHSETLIHTYQTGTITATINDYGEIANLPAYVVSQMHNSCWNRNKRTFTNKTLVRPGSLLRLTYQERIASPFVFDEVLGGYPAYKVKFYIEYASK